MGGAVTWLCKSENQDYIPIVEEDSDVLHNLVDTGHYRWLGSDGNSYILTDLHPCGATDGISAKLKYVASDFYFCSIEHNNVPNGWFNFMSRISNGTAGVSWNYDSVASIPVTIGSIYNVLFQGSSVTVNGTNYGIVVDSTEKTGYLTLFACYQIVGSTVTIIPRGSMAVHEMKVYRNNNLVYHFVPFKRNNSYGLLDVHNPSNPVFYSNSGTGDFTCTIE